jgi:hypothetical protein
MITNKSNMNHKLQEAKRNASKHALLLIIAIATGSLMVEAQLPAFPGAEGYGANTTGGRGGSVIEVTNLNNSGTGSLRAAIGASGARTVVFRVSGTIELQSDLKISNDNITIAGQTAPGDGICLRNYTLKVNANNVIIRYIRSRLGDVAEVDDDAMNGRNRSNIIIDHCSMSWSVDECASFYDNENFTMQWCLLSESLYESVHDKGRHGYGGIWGGKGASFHHNLLAHHSSRNPRFCGSRYSNQPELEKIDHCNNVIYNWGGNSCYGAEGGSYNIVGNYYRYGPATRNKDRIINPWSDNGGNNQPAGVWGSFYIADNYVWGYPATTADNWKYGVEDVSESIKDEIRSEDPFDGPAITGHTAEEAFEHVLAAVGAVLPTRDVLDARIVREAMTGTTTYGGAYGTGKGIIDTQATVGDWPVLNSETAPADTDKDGMPDDWEDSVGLDKNDAADRNGDLNGNGYTNLEDYLNSLVEAFEYVVRPIRLQVDTIIPGGKVKLSWEDISDNETGFSIERSDGSRWTEIATTGPGQEEYTDSIFTGYGLHYYRIKTLAGELESFYTDSIKANVVDVGIQYAGDGRHPDFRLYPNPMKEQLNIHYTLKEACRVRMALSDLAGRVVAVIIESDQTPGDYHITLERASLKGGLYFLHLETGEARAAARVIIAE